MINRVDHRSALRRALLAIAAVSLSGCGDDAKPPTRTEAAAPSVSASPSADGAPPPATAEGPVPSSHTPVTASEHQTFEKLYTEQCIKSQQGSPDTVLESDQQLGAVCDCMAKEISRRISKADAVHFNVKKEFPIDVVMMTEAAANLCMGRQP